MANFAHGRQTAPRLEDIRKDHRERYSLAAELLGGLKVLDAGCGIGYGSFMMARAGCEVAAVDADPEAVFKAGVHYYTPGVRHYLTSISGDLMKSFEGRFDAVVCFEVLEHIEDPAAALRQFRKIAPRLLCSVPNEDVMPFEETRPLGHLRHYTPDQFDDLLTNWPNCARLMKYHQKGKLSQVETGWTGRTLIADLEA